MKQGFPNKTWLPLGEALTASRPLPEKWSKDYLVTVPWSYSLLNYSIVWNASITGLFDQVLQALLCNFSPLCKADSVVFGSLTRPHMTVSLTAEIHAREQLILSRQSSCLSLNRLSALIFAGFITRRGDWIQLPPLLSRQANHSFIKTLGPTDVTEVFSVIADSGGPWLQRAKLPQVLPTKQWKAPFQVRSWGAVLWWKIEERGNRSVLLERTGNDLIKHRSQW